MDDVISKKAEIDYFVTNVGFHDEDGYPIEDECELREIWTGYFDGIPTAQPERIKGHWIEHDDGLTACECSVCHEKYALYEEDVFGRNYCPNCGAKMEVTT